MSYSTKSISFVELIFFVFLTSGLHFVNFFFRFCPKKYVKLFRGITLLCQNYKGIFFHDDVVEPLKPILEDWLGLRLSEEDIAMFGIRFLRGAWMSLFADPYPAHAFGIILQVSKYVCT